MFTIGECRICGTGPLGLRTCGRCGQVVVLCDECDAVWADADFAGEPIFADDPHLPCPGCSDSLWEPPSHWASQSEIDTTEWITQALRDGRVVLEKGTPLTTSDGGDDPSEG